MAFTHQKTVTVTPVDDNYSWTKSGDGNGNWVQITQAQGDTWNFAVSDNTGPTRTCVCTVTHSNGVTSDSFTITQAGVGAPPPTTTTTTEAPTTTTTTEAPTTTTTTTEVTADPVYRTTWVAINNVANTFVAGNDSPTTVPDDDQWSEATAGTPVTEYFFIHPQDGYSFTGVDNVTIGGVTQGTAVVDTSLTSNGNIKVIVTHTTGSANTTINVTLNGAAVADPVPTYTSFVRVGGATALAETSSFNLRISGSNIPDGTTIQLASIGGGDPNDYTWAAPVGWDNLPEFTFTNNEAQLTFQLNEDANTEGQEVHAFTLALNDSLGNVHGLGNVNVTVNDTSTGTLTVEFNDADNLIYQTDASSALGFTAQVTLDPDGDMDGDDWFWTTDPTGATASDGYGAASEPDWIEGTTINNNSATGATISWTAGGETGQAPATTAPPSA